MNGPATSLAGCCMLLVLGGCISIGLAPSRFEAAVDGLRCAESPPVRIEGPGGAPLRLIAVGDTGKASPQLHATLDAMSRVPDVGALLLLGDNAYPCGLRGTEHAKWGKVVDPILALGKPVYPVLGNHDWGRRTLPYCFYSNPAAQIDKSGQPGYENWRFPAANYVVETPLAEIVFFDSTPIAKGWQGDLEEPLCALRAVLNQPKRTPWRIVVAHDPLYSCGSHGGDSETLNMRRAVEPLLETVDLYVSGHDHDLEIRTDPAPPPIFVVSGAGSKIRDRGIECAPGDNFKLEGGFAVVELSEEDLSVRVYCNGQAAPCTETSLPRR